MVEHIKLLAHHMTLKQRLGILWHLFLFPNGTLGATIATGIRDSGQAGHVDPFVMMAPPYYYTYYKDAGL